MTNLYRVVDAKVEIENVKVQGYFEGKLPVVYFKTREFGWVQRLGNPLPPSDTSPVTAEREAKESIGRLINREGLIIPHARLTVNSNLLDLAAERDTIGKLIRRAAGWQVIGHLGRENGLDLEGHESQHVDRFQITYAETPEIKDRVTQIFEAYLKDLKE